MREHVLAANPRIQGNRQTTKSNGAKSGRTLRQQGTYMLIPVAITLIRRSQIILRTAV